MNGSEDSNKSHASTEWTTLNHIWIYTSPFILIFAICGNILTMMVMRRQRMRGTSTSMYLTLLAAGDMTVVVVGLGPEWLSQLHVVDMWDVHPWVCKSELYLYYTALDFAIWMLVAFSCDRFVAVCFPLKKREYCTKRRAIITAAIIFAVANLNLHVFWTRGADFNNSTGQVENCRYLPGYVHFELSIRPPIVFVAAFLVPSLMIAASNCCIVIRMMSTKDMRKQTVRNTRGLQRLRKGLTQTTAMCVSTSVAFVILVLPNIVLFFGKKWWWDSARYPIAKAIASQLMYLHHSINFILYSMTGSRFRQELGLLCRQTAKSPFIGRIRQWSTTSFTSSERRSRVSYRFTPSPGSPNGCHGSPRRGQRSSRGGGPYTPGTPLTTIKEYNSQGQHTASKD